MFAYFPLCTAVIRYSSWGRSASYFHYTIAFLAVLPLYPWTVCGESYVLVGRLTTPPFLQDFRGSVHGAQPTSSLTYCRMKTACLWRTLPWDASHRRRIRRLASWTTTAKQISSVAKILVWGSVHHYRDSICSHPSLIFWKEKWRPLKTFAAPTHGQCLRSSVVPRETSQQPRRVQWSTVWKAKLQPRRVFRMYHRLT